MMAKNNNTSNHTEKTRDFSTDLASHYEHEQGRVEDAGRDTKTKYHKGTDKPGPCRPGRSLQRVILLHDD